MAFTKQNSAVKSATITVGTASVNKAPYILFFFLTNIILIVITLKQIEFSISNLKYYKLQACFVFLNKQNVLCLTDGCKNQADKRRINVEAYLYSPQPMSSLQLINPFNLVTGLAVIACVCIIALFVAIFIALQVNNICTVGRVINRDSMDASSIPARGNTFEFF